MPRLYRRAASPLRADHPSWWAFSALQVLRWPPMTPHDEALAVVGRLKEAAKGATPGPWQAEQTPPAVGGPDSWTVVAQSLVYWVCQLSRRWKMPVSSGEGYSCRADAHYIAACDPDTILALCEVVEASVKRRQLELDRSAMTARLARREIAREAWVEHGSMHARADDHARDALDAALARLKERG